MQYGNAVEDNGELDFAGYTETPVQGSLRSKDCRQRLQVNSFVSMEVQ